MNDYVLESMINRSHRHRGTHSCRMDRHNRQNCRCWDYENPPSRPSKRSCWGCLRLTIGRFLALPYCVYLLDLLVCAEPFRFLRPRNCGRRHNHSRARNAHFFQRTSRHISVAVGLNWGEEVSCCLSNGNCRYLTVISWFFEFFLCFSHYPHRILRPSNCTRRHNLSRSNHGHFFQNAFHESFVGESALRFDLLHTSNSFLEQ